MKKIILITLTFTFLITLVNAQKNVSITGKLKNNTDFSQVFLDDIIRQTVIDSAGIDASGNFKFNLTITQSDFYRLRFDDKNSIFLVIEPNENITISLDFKDILNPKITGSKNSSLVYNTANQLSQYDYKLAEEQKKIEAEKANYIRNMILNNLNSLSSLFFIDNLDINQHLDVYKKLDKSLSVKYPNHPLVKALHDNLQKTNHIDVDNQAPEIDLPDVNGKNVKLSSLRGKYVLIDFWASWCAPCRMESPNMVAVYNKYKDKGFTIYSVSLDKSKKAWLAAIKSDKLGDWVHVSDLKYWNSAAAKTYKVRGIPYTVLLDKTGKIIAKGLRGEELKKKLAEILE